VNAAQLWCILSEARRWPASGDCGGMNPPMRCTVGPDSQHMTITVDWTTEKNGVCTYRLPARWVHQGRLFEEPITFTMPHTPILTVVRDPMNAEILGEVTMSIPGSGGTHVVLHNESFEFHAPVVNEDTHWGQDLGDVLGDTHFRWVNAGHVMVWPDDFEEGPIKLSRLPSDPQSPYQYRASVVVCDDIIPNVDLYNEINAINAKASGGYRLVVMTDKVVAMSDYTIENYKELGRHMEAFAKGVTGIGKLLSPLTVQFTR
jgi:hypothetical protein